MRAFISSVRRGLEAERDALPGLLLAIGHQPVVFENFTAQPTPSREACLKGVADSDVYLLLLGPNYGYRFPDTNQSPTHDEWVAARKAGKPIFVFKKEGVEVEPEQAAFIREVGEYGTGVFYATFDDVADLQVKVAAALRNHEAAPSPLIFQPLATPLGVEWKDDWSSGSAHRQESHAVIELHVVSIDGTPLTSRSMTGAPEVLARALRATGTIPVTAGADIEGDAASASVRVTNANSRGGVDDTQFLGARLFARGQLSLWSSLPRDQLGSILDDHDLVQTLTANLCTVGALHVLPGERFGLAAGLSGALTVLSRGKATGVSRTSASLFMSPRPVRAILDESVTAAAFNLGAVEVAQHLATMVIKDFEASS